MAKIYVAARWTCKPQARSVMDALRDRGHAITYDWTLIPDDAPYDAEAQEEIRAVQACDALVVLPHETGRGLYAELGAALALNKPVVCLAEQRDVITGGKYECVFLSHPNVWVLGTLAEVVGALEQL